jgi:hypothetical protein
MKLINLLLHDFLTWCAIVLGVLSNLTPASVLKMLNFDAHTTAVVGTLIAIGLIIIRAVTLAPMKKI